MKNLLLLLLFITALSACADLPQQSAEQGKTSAAADSPVAKIQIPNSGCYINVSGKDTIGLKIEVFPNVITGVLRYDFKEKDKSKGDIDGRLKGDTLIADYSFMSEGVRSTRQVAFLIKDSVVIEGYGDMEEKDDKMIFKDLRTIDFSKGATFKKVPCLNYDPTNHSEPVATVSGGSEVLFLYQWNLIELQGQKVPSSGRIPHLLFYPGQVSRVSGNTGCNKLNGTFNLSGGNVITFSPLVTTKMACPDNSTEDSFIKALGQVDNWRIINNELLLHKGKMLVAKLKGVSVQSSKATDR